MSDIFSMNTQILSFDFSSTAMTDDDMDRHIEMALNATLNPYGEDPVPCMPYRCPADIINNGGGGGSIE